MAIIVASSGMALAQEDLQYLGGLKCQGCHFAPSGQWPRDLVLLTEARTWKNRDKHSMAVRLLVGISRSDEDGRLLIEPNQEANSVGLNMLIRLGVLQDDDLKEAVARAAAKNPELQTAQDAVRMNRKKTLEAKLKNLEDDTVVTSDDIDALEKLENDSEEQVKAIELEYMTPLVDKFYASATGRGCLACHADLREDVAWPIENEREKFATNHKSESFRRDSVPDGVSCEACHGPSEKWEKPHYELAFRTTPPHEKIALGLNDLRHPAVRANQCYSCHIGNVKQGKFIEHSWYMAGHPPLPSIEVETFAHDMPRHWRYFKEKKNVKKGDEFVATIKADGDHAFEIDSKFPQTKEVLVGGVEALRKSVALLADAHVKYKDSAIPDFAAFDCLACHQELRTKPVVTRDSGKFDPFIPGRPSISRWSFALADLAVEVAGNPAQRTAFDGQIKLLREALTRQPFGDRASTATAAATMQTLLRGLETDLAKQETTQEIAVRAFDRLKHTATHELLDFHSARQTVWAMQVIATEAMPKSLPETLKYPKGDKPSSDVARYLQIRLPAGAKTVITDPENLPVLLNRIDAYDPVTFRKLMCELFEVPFKDE